MIHSSRAKEARYSMSHKSLKKGNLPLYPPPHFR